MSGRRDLHVLVVDDSAVIRQALAQILGHAGFGVDTAADPLIGLGKMRRRRPDVILLDLEMPRMDGLTFLRRLMGEQPVPVVVLSSHAERGTETALEALEEGALEVLAKPPVGIREFLDRAAGHLVEVVRAASRARMPVSPRKPRAASSPASGWPRRATGVDRRTVRPRVACRIVAVAASTGGPEALRKILTPLPEDVPGILVVQHMPKGFTGMFAQRLDEACRITVREAADDDVVEEGVALVAPGDRHVEVESIGAELRIRLSDGPPVGRHRPSADVLFRSVARAAGAMALGVILTGMGRDGAEGLLAMRRAGARTLALERASCVVYGMPARAVEAGAVERSVPLEAMTAAIVSRVHQRLEPL